MRSKDWKWRRMEQRLSEKAPRRSLFARRANVRTILSFIIYLFPYLTINCTLVGAAVCRIRAVARFTIISISNIINFCSEQTPPRCRHITVLQTRRGKICGAKLGSGDEWSNGFRRKHLGAVYSPDARMYGLRYKRQAKHLPQSTVIQRQAILDYLVA